MPTWLELLSVLGPLAAILPRVAVVMAAAVVALMAAGLCGRAVRGRRPLLFLAAWLIGLGAVMAHSLVLRASPVMGGTPCCPVLVRRSR